MELLTEYGIVVLLAVTALTFQVLRIAWSRVAAYESAIRAFIFSIIASFPLACTVNSTFWAAPTTWTMIALLLGGGCVLEAARSPEIVPETPINE